MTFPSNKSPLRSPRLCGESLRKLQAGCNPPRSHRKDAKNAKESCSCLPGPVSPKGLLLPYQRQWVDNAARFKIGLWARQTGKDFSCASEAVEDSIRRPGTQWTVLATGERQALESVAQAKLWAEAYNLALADYQEDRDGSEALLKSAEILWPNGSRYRALPANPQTARGLSTNLILTEFAFHEKPDEIWRAIYPSISNPLRGGEKKLRIISTPNGLGNKFADLWTKNFGVENAAYDCQKITIHDAVRLGLPIDIEALRAGLDDPEGWAQEYECEFLDSSAVLLPYDLILLCESDQAAVEAPPEFWLVKPAHPIYLGIDFGRKKDLTVCWTLEQIGDVLHTREVLELSKTPTPQQIEILRPRIAAAARVSFDYTGPGTGMGDFLALEFGEWNPDMHLFGKIELCTFTNELKTDIFPKLRMAFENRTLRIPVSRAIREDLHSMARATTPGGNITYRAPHTADGHADRCTALALARRAGGSAFAPFGYQAVEMSRSPRFGDRHIRVPRTEGALL